MPHYATDANQWMQENASKLAQIRESAEHSRQAIESSKGHARSRDGSVDVVVDASGEIESLNISRAAMSLGPDALARALMATVRSARQAGAEELRKKLSENPVPVDGMNVLEVLGVSESEGTASDVDALHPSLEDEPWGQRSILQRP